MKRGVVMRRALSGGFAYGGFECYVALLRRERDARCAIPTRVK
jgi:hypothetical protein